MTTRPGFPPGERFDIGGYSLNLHRTGQGAPPAIFDTGLGVTSLLWARVLPAVGAFTTACAFDRAGYGGSDPAPGHMPRTSAQIVHELRLLLQNIASTPPYVLVGHSLLRAALVAMIRQPQNVAAALPTAVYRRQA